jgi:alpha-N-acetylglucosaminidase
MKFASAFLLLFAAPFAFADQVSSANGVMHRLLGRRADAFHFTLIPKQGNLDVFKVEASNGQVQIAGSTGVALTRGAYTYLREACHCIVTWDGDQLTLPAQLPSFPTTEVVCPNQYRHYFNVCTFGYTMAFWDWKKWERGIDWMALHGINMPLAMTGQERVWEIVWMKYGLTDLQVQNFLSGPAFLPWHWMGNIDAHGGPMPQDFMDHAVELQKKILGRERELGMTPVVPGFSGFVPKEFGDIYPRTRMLTSSGWCDFPPTHQLDARDPMFGAIQKRFIEAYTKLYGTDHLYLCDLYNEMKPTVSKDNRLEDLAQTGEAIYNSIKEADPQGTWVMQGWLFHNDPGFWKEPEISAFLGGVPDDRMILLDLAADNTEIWRQSAAFRKKKYIWNLLHGFGGATPLFGDLQLAATKPIQALNDPTHGAMVGMGITMEGINENAAQYELMCDAMWGDQPLDSTKWMREYVSSRYGCDLAVAGPIADAIRVAFYTNNDGGSGFPHYQDRPSLHAMDQPGAGPKPFLDILSTMLKAPADVQKQALFRRDLIDVAKRYCSELINTRIGACIVAEKGGNDEAAKVARAQFDSLMLDLDALLDTEPQYRMSGWISDARRVSAAADQMESNARLQVTVWGGPDLADYAAKEWSGLVGDFYRNRWDRFFDAVGKPGYADDVFRKNSAAWELDWCSKTTLPRIKKVDPIEQVKKLMAEAG